MACIWMGDLESYMDESFIKRAFATMGVMTLSIKVISNKISGGPAGYCFVELTDAATAERCLLRLNGKFVPGSNPPKKFKLNHANHTKKPEVSTKPKSEEAVTPATYDVAQYYQQYMNYCAQWGYDPYSGYSYAYPAYGSLPTASSASTANVTENQTTSEAVSTSASSTAYAYEDNTLEDPDVFVDAEETNRKFIAKSEELYDSLISCHWQPLDSATSKIPAKV
ncbi:tRNA selenocysteine 1-associated protein 1-like isoform X2 [Protopterus annectens]|uniref:tRNA selenocysteine 1-associated protein 1-like isoform X2 n=1 Tax=Protopterus annectens TaxID=7888 RepID=UPI001CFC42C1|nr:tRNA selenocysteine 1-associated protein 1-like isoform X2 [Protopterus annectens]